jgi:hypothetical protein
MTERDTAQFWSEEMWEPGRTREPVFNVCGKRPVDSTRAAARGLSADRRDPRWQVDAITRSHLRFAARTSGQSQADVRSPSGSTARP